MLQSRKKYLSFSWKDVERHSSLEDCWIVVQEKIYDLTGIIDYHPGGAEEILSVAGKDCTEIFFAAGHSSHVLEAFKSLYVGDVANNEDETYAKCDELNFVPREMHNVVFDKVCRSSDWEQMYFSISIQSKRQLRRKHKMSSGYEFKSSNSDYENSNIIRDFDLSIPMPGQVFVLRINLGDGRYISRVYTPITWTASSISFCVKIYKTGKMTQNLKKLKPKSKIQVRGPIGLMIPNSDPSVALFPPEMVQPYPSKSQNIIESVSLVAAGSGITPMVSIINHFLGSDVPISLLVYANSYHEVMCSNDLAISKARIGEQLRIIVGISSDSQDPCQQPVSLGGSKNNVEVETVFGKTCVAHMRLLSFEGDKGTIGNRLFVVSGPSNFRKAVLRLLRSSFQVLPHEVELLGVA